MPIIAIDFDGTIVKDEYPGIGKPLPGAIQAINELYDDGYCIIINSCRAREREDEMIGWLNRNGVKYCHCNENCCERIVKYRTDCRKISADCIIDDKSLMMVNMEQENAWHNVKHMIRLKFGENHERECGKE